MKLLIFAAPSGAGKTTIVSHLLEQYKQLAFSISATTRSPRVGEIDGENYYFLSLEAWQKRIEADAFLEWEEVYQDQYYGTLKSEVERLWAAGKVVIFDVDVKGALNIKQYYGDKALSIFVKPPSLEILLERLSGRGTENEESIAKRTQKAAFELSFENKFDIVLLNEDLPQALKNAEQIVEEFLR